MIMSVMTVFYWPHRVEFAGYPDEVDRFFIDGPMEGIRSPLIPDPAPNLASPSPGGTIYFESPKNPHSGCLC